MRPVGLKPLIERARLVSDAISPCGHALVLLLLVIGDGDV